jgi:hypothetical protein
LSPLDGRYIMSTNRGYQQRTRGAVNMSIIVERLDHLVLTVASITRTVAFYETVLGMSAVRFGPDGDRVALRFGEHKINLHEVGRELDLRAERATAGSSRGRTSAAARSARSGRSISVIRTVT